MSQTTRKPHRSAGRDLILGACVLLMSCAAAAAGAGRHRAPRSEPPDAKTLFDRLDRDGDGKVTAADAPEGERGERMSRRLERLDTDGDGELSLAELEQALEKRGRHGGVRSPEERLKARDSDGDGRLSREELAPSGRLLERADRDGDGAVSKDEIAQGRHGERALRRFQALDRDADGFVTRAELEAARRERFDRADTDGDGYLDLAELSARRAHGRKGPGAL